MRTVEPVEQAVEPLKEYSTIVSIVAAVISLLAFLVSWRGTTIARRAYLLSEGEAKKRDPKIRVDLLAAWTLHDQRVAHRYVLNLTIINPTDAPNTVARIELLAHLSDKTSARDSMTILKLPPSSGFEWVGLDSRIDGADLQLPLQIDARSACSGWVRFAFPASLLGAARIEHLELRLEDVFGNHAGISYVNPMIIVSEGEQDGRLPQPEETESTETPRGRIHGNDDP